MPKGLFLVWSLVALPEKDGSAEPSPAPTAPTKGLPETAPGQRPLRDAASDACFLEYKSRSSGWSFREKQYLTLAPSFKLSSWPSSGRYDLPTLLFDDSEFASGQRPAATITLARSGTGLQQAPPENHLAGNSTGCSPMLPLAAIGLAGWR